MADYLMTEDSEQCERCEKPVGLVWSVRDEVWAKVTGYTDGSGILCIPCFDQLAYEKGIFVRWVAKIHPSFEDRMIKVKDD